MLLFVASYLAPRCWLQVCISSRHSLTVTRTLVKPASASQQLQPRGLSAGAGREVRSALPRGGVHLRPDGPFRPRAPDLITVQNAHATDLAELSIPLAMRPFTGSNMASAVTPPARKRPETPCAASGGLRLGTDHRRPCLRQSGGRAARLDRGIARDAR